MQTTMQDLTIILENRPGTLAKATSAIASAGINLEGGAGFDCGGEGIFHALFRSDSDAIAAKRALEGAGFKVKAEHDVLLVDVEDRPGAAATIFQEVADRELNIDLVYVATKTRIVIGGAQVQQIREALQPLTTAAR